MNKSHIICTDEDPGLQIKSFAVINLRGVSTNKTIIHTYTVHTHARFYQEQTEQFYARVYQEQTEQLQSDIIS